MAGCGRTLANARVAKAAAEQAAVAQLGELLPAILASRDAAEGVRSFLERRAASFTGR
jgi:enoyl-CoA hydratase